jgi:hypothetical protein
LCGVVARPGGVRTGRGVSVGGKGLGAFEVGYEGCSEGWEVYGSA